MKGKKLQTEERHKGLQHQCNSRGQQRGAQPGTNHRCVLQQPLQRERGLTCRGTLRTGPGSGSMHCGMRERSSKALRSGKPSPPPPLPPGRSTRGRHGWPRRAQPCVGRERACPGERRACAGLPACVGDQAARAAQPRARHPRPAAPRTAPAIPRGLPGAGASLTAAAARDGLRARSSPRKDVGSGPPRGDLLGWGFLFSFCWPSS